MSSRVSLSEVCFKKINLIVLKREKLDIVRLVGMQDNKDVKLISCIENKECDMEVTDVAKVDLIEFVIT